MGCKITKKILRICLFTIGALILFDLLVVGLVFVPPIQQKIVNSVTNALSQKTESKISIDKIYLSPTLKLHAEGFTIYDHRGEPMIAADQLQSRLLQLKFAPLRLSLDNTKGDHVRVILRKYEYDKQINISIWAKKLSKKKKEKNDFLLKIKSIDLTNTYFVLIDDHKRRHNPDSTVDYAFFEFKDIDWHLHHFQVKGSEVSAFIDRMAYTQYTGFQLLNLTGDFKIGSDGLTLNNATLVTPSSHLFLDFAFQYDSWADYGNFLDSITICADVKTSTFDLGALACFAPATRGMNDTLVFSCHVNGPVNDLNITDFRANYQLNTQLMGSVRLQNITDFFHANISLQLPNNQVNIAELAQFHLPKGKTIPIPAELQNFGDATINVQFDGEVTKGFTTSVSLQSSRENATLLLQTHQNEANGNIDYTSTIATTNLHLGKILAQKDLIGNTALTAKVDGSVDPKDFINTLKINIKANAKRLDFTRYPIQNIHLNGSYQCQQLKAQLAIHDPNCQLSARTRIDWKKPLPRYWLSASIDSLSATQLFKNMPTIDSSHATGFNKLVYYVQQHPNVALRVDSLQWELNGKNLKTLSGNIFVENISYQQDGKLLDTEWLRLVVLNNGNTQIYRFTSNLFNAGLATNYELKYLPHAFIDIAYNYCGNLLPSRQIEKPSAAETAEKFFDLDLSLNRVRPILQLFLPDLRLANGSFVKISTTSTHQNDQIAISLPRFGFKDNLQLKEVEITGVQQAAGQLKLDVNLQKITIGKQEKIEISDCQLQSVVGNNLLNLTLAWQNPTALSAKRSSLSSHIQFPAHKQVSVEITQSDIAIKDDIFHFNDQNLIEIKQENIQFHHLVFGDEHRRIEFNGRLEKGNDSLVALGENVDLELINKIIQMPKMSFDGDLSANLQVRTVRNERVLFGAVMVRDFEFNHESFGNLFASAAVPTNNDILFTGGFINPHSFPANATIHNYTYRNFLEQKGVDINLEGKFSMKQKELRVTANIDSLKLGIIAPFLSSFSHVMRGDASGKIDLVMNADSLYFTGKAFVRRAELGIKPLNTIYLIEGQTIDFTKDGFEFNNVLLRDKFGNIGTLQGYVHHTKFNNFDLNLGIKTNRLLILNTVQQTDNPFYGDAFVSGDVRIYGNMDKLYFAGNNLRTERGTKFGLPISFADKVSDSETITFKKRPTNLSEEVAQSLTTPNQNSQMEMDFNFIIDVTPAADILLDLDLSAFGGSIKTAGEGKLHFTYNTQSDISLLGDVKLQSGAFMMTFANIVSKKFNLMEGGRVEFPGSLNDITINVQAAYTTNASVAEIIPTETANTQRRMPVKAFLNFNGNLNDPASINFTFDLPNATSDMKTLFYSAIDTSNIQSKTSQFFSLVMLDKFSNSANNFNNSALESTGINLLTSTLSNFISQQIKYVDLDFKYQNANPNQSAQYSVAASTSLFNDRTLIQGYFGYVDDKEMGNTQSQFIGDFSIEQKLNEQGTWRVKVFNVTNQDELRNATHNNPYAQGVAVIYKQDFNNRTDLAESFKRDKDRKKKRKTKQK